MRLIALAVFVGAATLVPFISQPARSGDFGTAEQKCDLAAANSTCHWEPRNCSQPPPAPAFELESETASYNAAVDRYNDYLREAQDYMQCIVKEGSGDVSQAFPALVKKAIAEKQMVIETNIQMAQRNMQISRRGMRPTTPVISSSPRDDMGH